MAISNQQISAKFLWAGTGPGDVTAGAAVDGYAKPTSTIVDTGYLIELPGSVPLQRENGVGTWNPAGAGSLTRTTVHFNSLTGLRFPTAAKLSFGAGNKIVTLMSLPVDFGALAALDQVDTAQIVDNAVTLAKQAHGTANRLIGYDGAGAPIEYSAGSNITIVSGQISASGVGGGGEANTGANVATNGVGVFDGKVGVTLNFRGVASLTTGGLTVALDDAQNDIDFSLVYASQAEAEAGTDNAKVMTALRVAQEMAALGGAPASAQYLVLSTSTNLSAERVLTPQHTIVGVDDGANGPYRISLSGDVASPGPSRVYGTTGLGVRGWKPSPDLSFHTVAPAATDDSPAGFIEGHIWVDTAAQNAYISVDDTDNAAVWDLMGGGGGGGTIASEAEARAGTNNTNTMTPLRVEQHHESREAKTAGSFNPGAVLIDDNRQFATFVQSGAVSFVKAGSGTFRPGKVIQVTIESDGAALNWSADFERLDISGTLPASLPAGLHTLFFGWNSDRGKIQVSVPTIVAEEIAGTLSNVILKKYDQTRAAQTGVTGALTLARANGEYHHVTHGAGNITSTTVTGWPASGTLGTVTLDIKQDGVGGRTWAGPSGFVWAGTTPTFNTAAGKTNVVTLRTTDGGTTGVMHYGNSF